MMGAQQVEQAALFYEFSLDRHVPAGHLLRLIDRFVELDGLRRELAPFYSAIGRPSIDPELMIRMLLVGYCFGIRSERRLCEEVHLNLAYRWFCRLGLDGAVPDHSTFSKNRHGRFRDSDLLRQLFEATVRRCMDEGLVGGDGFAVDASLIRAEANRQRFHPGELPPDLSSRAVDEYLAVLDDAAFGAATSVVPSRVSPSDPAARYTSAHGGQAQFCYATNYLIDVQNAVIVDVEASTAVRQAEVTAAKRMIERVHDDLGLWPRKLIADTGYGSAEMLAWLVHERDIHPHIPVFDKSARNNGTFARADFTYDARRDAYTCPAGKFLTRYQRRHGCRTDQPHADGFFRYRASKADCDTCALKQRCCPGAEARKVPRSVHEGARNLARAIAEENEWLVSRRERKKIEMLFAHLKRILRLDRLRLRGPNGARDEFHLAAAAQNLRKLAKFIPMPIQPVPA